MHAHTHARTHAYTYMYPYAFSHIGISSLLCSCTYTHLCRPLYSDGLVLLALLVNHDVSLVQHKHLYLGRVNDLLLEDPVEEGARRTHDDVLMAKLSGLNWARRKGEEEEEEEEEEDEEEENEGGEEEDFWKVRHIYHAM